MLDIKESHKILLSQILNFFLKDKEIRVFGSRVNGTAKQYSDIDLVIMGEEPISAEIMCELKEALEESNLPFQVDIVEWWITSEEFRKIIKRQAILFE